MDTIPVPDVSAPTPTPVGGSASAKRLAKLKGRVSPTKEKIIARFRNLSEKKEDSTEKLLKKPMKSLKRHECYPCENLYWRACFFVSGELYHHR